MKKDVVVATCNVRPENKIQETIQLAGAEDKENLLPRGAAKKEESKEMTTLNDVIDTLQSGLAGNTAANRFGDALAKFTTAREVLNHEKIDEKFRLLVTSVEAALGNQVAADTPDNQKTLTLALNALIKNLEIDNKGLSNSGNLKTQVERLQTSLNGIVLDTLINRLNTNTEAAKFTSDAKPAFENAMNALPAGDLKNKITAVHAALTDFDPADQDKRVALQTSLVDLIAEGSIPDALKAQVKNLQTSLNGVVLDTLTNGLNANTEAAKFTSHAKPAFENAMNALPAGDLKNKITAVHTALTDFDPANPDKRIALNQSGRFDC